MTRNAEILAIGDEFVYGQKVDTNSAWLSQELLSVGCEVRRVTVVGDGEADLAAAIRDSCGRADVVVATGGIGPTEDDRTRAAAARAGGVELYFDAEAWRGIEVLFRRYARSTGNAPPPSNRRQAEFPEGAVVLPNRWGSAPGFRLDIDGAAFYSLPGVPREMRAMWQAHLRPELAVDAAAAAEYHCMHVIGCREAELGEMLEDFMVEGGETTVGITASGGQLTIRIASFAATAVSSTSAELRARLGTLLVYEGNHTLAEEVGRRLIAEGITVSFAESCTGGLLAGALTEVDGISSVFHAGFVTYSNEAKSRDLHVSEDLIAQDGAVSEKVAAAMAEGAARRAGSRAAVAITGVAGPGGGTETHPVGMVCFGVTMDGRTESFERRFGDLGRELLRQRSVREALLLLYRALPG